MTQSFGPEARGGACSAQCILSNEPILYPYVTRPDILIVMSQEAYSKFAPELKENGMLIVEEDLVRIGDLKPGVKVFSIPATRLAEELGKRMVLNIVMVGFFAAVTGLVDADALRKAVADSVPSHFADLNLKAFDKGFEYGAKKLRAIVEAVETHEPAIQFAE
jgi:2-oxoglutarate ferredoxin oxidoreductase subunit gamma